MPFLHRKLRVYQGAVDWTLRVHELTVGLPWQWRHLGDQLRRAATSIALNTAEGAAESAEQRRFFRYARRSAAETEAGFYVLFRAGVVSAGTLHEAEDAANTLSAMLSSLMRRSEHPNSGARPSRPKSVDP